MNVAQMQHLLLLLGNKDDKIKKKEDTNMEKQSFGEYIVQLRSQKHMSQRKLAEAAELTNSTISRIEANSVNPDPATLEKIAVALNVDKAILLTKCGYSEVPVEYVVLARKTGELPREKQEELYRIFNTTIDSFLLSDEEDD